MTREVADNAPVYKILACLVIITIGGVLGSPLGFGLALVGIGGCAHTIRKL